MMEWVVCSFLLSTGVPSCGKPTDLQNAVAMTVASNLTFPFDPKVSTRTPATIYPADEQPK